MKSCAIVATACNTVLAAVLALQNRSVLSGLGCGLSVLALICIVVATILEKKEES